MKVTIAEAHAIAKLFSATEVHDNPKYGWKWKCRSCRDHVYMSRSHSEVVTIKEQKALSKHSKSAEHEQEQILRQLSDETRGGYVELFFTK